MKRVKKLTCGWCGIKSRLRLDPDTEDPSGERCSHCGKSDWLNLPILRMPVEVHYRWHPSVNELHEAFLKGFQRQLGDDE